jgi:CBS domain-containing protein
MAMFVSQILSVKGRQIFSVPPSATLAEAADSLAKHNIGAVLVLNAASEPVGILSERDIVRVIAKNGPQVLARRVEECMTSPVAACEQDDYVEDVAELMTRRRFRHLPVVEGGRVIGLISIGDVVKSRIEETVREAEELKAYIAIRY